MSAILQRPDGATIVYDRIVGMQPGVVFLHGLNSDRNGTKADMLAAHCRAKGYGYLRYDMFGHGQSSGRFEDGGISRWTADAVAVLDELTEGPQVIIGSSMGGWVMLRAALARPQRITGLVGIATAADFTEEGMWAKLSPAQRQELMAVGVVKIPSEYRETPYVVSRHLIEDGRLNLVFGRGLAIDCPVRLLQGQRDDTVPWNTALRVAEEISGNDVEVVLVKDGDHRLSRPKDFDLLRATVDALVMQVRP